MKFKLVKSTLILSILACSISSNLASEKLDFSYPELHVTPLASKRIKMEAIEENNINMFSQWHQTLPGLLTFTSGIMQFGSVNEFDDPDKNSAYAGTFVGAFWLGANFYLTEKYRPYTKSHSKIKKMPARNKREMLIRERYAESQINKLGRYGRIMKWLNVSTNAAVNFYMLSNTEDGSRTKILHATSILASFMPLFFQNDWETVKREQRRYKKKIYAPIASAGLIPVGNTGKFAPGLVTHFSF